MLPITRLSDHFFVSGQLSPADFARVADRGFGSIINFRPDGEAPGQLDTDAASQCAHRAGLSYAAVPTTKFDVFADDVVSQAEALIATLPGPILAYCASGQRAAIVWAAANARATPVGDVLQVLSAAGFKLDFLRDDLELQADRAQWSAEAPAAPALTDELNRAAA